MISRGVDDLFNGWTCCNDNEATNTIGIRTLTALSLGLLGTFAFLTFAIDTNILICFSLEIGTDGEAMVPKPMGVGIGKGDTGVAAWLVSLMCDTTFTIASSELNREPDNIDTQCLTVQKGNLVIDAFHTRPFSNALDNDG